MTKEDAKTILSMFLEQVLPQQEKETGILQNDLKEAIRVLLADD